LAALVLASAVFTHAYESAVEQVNSTESPSQRVVNPLEVIKGDGVKGVTETAIVEFALWQPFASSMKALYTPAVITVIDALLIPLLQVIPLPGCADKIVEAP
jgi:hypothetical protein